VLYLILRIAFSSYKEKSIDKRMDEVISIESTRGIAICEIGKEKLHQLLRRWVFKIGSKPQVTLGRSVQFRVDLVYE